MNKILVTLIAISAPLLTLSNVSAQELHSFSFNAANVAGFPDGSAARMTGGGVYNPDPAIPYAKAGGSFRCLSDVTSGPLAGCKAGEGVRWDAVTVLAQTGFKCTGATTEPGKTAVTDAHTLVLLADFYKQGNGDDEFTTAKMIVSDGDLAPEAALPGQQNVWIEKVGCDSGITNFN